MENREIDFALVEAKRPPIYTAMKYWGKKPHNIWGAYIENYTPENGTYLDPFSGSAMSAFEAVKHNRKAVAFDINPLTSFMIEVYSIDFNESTFIKAVKEIVSKIKLLPIYNKYFHTTCSICGAISTVQHFKWENRKIYELGHDCPQCKKRSLKVPDSEDEAIAYNLKEIDIDKWYPDEKFYNSPSFTEAFKKNIGGQSFSDIWTKRNLYVLSEIFHLIQNQTNKDIQKLLMFGFIQTLHLSSKMCVPRRENAKRPFSTSWGRSAYICSKRQMEMNPLLLFEGNCLGKQSVQSALKSVKQYLGKVPKSINIENLKDNSNKNDYDIVYGMIDINRLTSYIEKESIDFILTDPPYGGLVQYIDLSYLWIIWLKKLYPQFTPNIDAEITIKDGIQDVETYTRKFTNGIKNLYSVLKPGGKIVFTFHNKDISVWNAFLRAIAEAGFKIEKVIHQQNRRTGESNVANPYGTSASDFYLRCVKTESITRTSTTQDDFEKFVIARAKAIILARNEPTPYQILFNGLLSDISKAGFDLDDFDNSLQHILKKYVDAIFLITKTNEQYGDLWWIIGESPRENIIPLSQRVEKTVRNLLIKYGSCSFDEILAEVFINFPNGLTPDIKKIDYYIKKYAYKSKDKWVYNGE